MRLKKEDYRSANIHWYGTVTRVIVSKRRIASWSVIYVVSTVYAYQPIQRLRESQKSRVSTEHHTYVGTPYSRNRQCEISQVGPWPAARVFLHKDDCQAHRRSKVVTQHGTEYKTVDPGKPVQQCHWNDLNMTIDASRCLSGRAWEDVVHLQFRKDKHDEGDQ